MCTANMLPIQAAAAIESFKMESPVKKLNFSQADKENKPFDADLATLEAEIDAKHNEETSSKALAQTTQKVEEETPAPKPEDDEPLLAENPGRFVLFPIKYHEVRVASPPSTTRKVFFV
jgi:ribonucleoside-diphosphate reductase subunit M2